MTSYGYQTGDATSIPNSLVTRYTQSALGVNSTAFTNAFLVSRIVSLGGDFSSYNPGAATGITIDDFATEIAIQTGIPAQASTLKADITDYIIAQLELGTPGSDTSMMAGILTAKQQGAGPSDPAILAGQSVKNDIAALSFEQWRKSNSTLDLDVYLIQFATINNNSSLASGVGAPINFVDIYNGFFNNNVPAFQSYLANYIQTLMYPTSGDSTVFIPSDQVGAWLTKIQQAYSLALNGTTSTTSSSLGASYRQTAILERIYSLIVEMIGTLQQVAASQSDRLRLLTNWQSAYTNQMQQPHTFTLGDGSSLSVDGNDTLSAKTTGIENANALNANFTELMRSRRSALQDEAKGLQSNLNQSNDSATQQANTGTTIIQQLSTLLGAIYR